MEKTPGLTALRRGDAPAHSLQEGITTLQSITTAAAAISASMYTQKIDRDGIK